jgi:hypothetical protein
MSQKLNSAIAVIGIDIGKNSFHIVGHDQRGAIVLRQKWSRGQVEPPIRDRYADVRHFSRVPWHKVAALQTARYRGTPEDQKACSGDARRHCRAMLDQGDMAVLACLQQQQRKLTRKCRAVLRKHGQ